MDAEALIGKTLTFEYDDETYGIKVLSEAEVRWTRTVGENPGTSDTEAYVYSQLSDDLGVISWVEADGLGVSNCLDFGNGRVTTHANMGRDVFENPGKLTVSG